MSFVPVLIIIKNGTADPHKAQPDFSMLANKSLLESTCWRDVLSKGICCSLYGWQLRYCQKRDEHPAAKSHCQRLEMQVRVTKEMLNRLTPQRDPN